MRRDEEGFGAPLDTTVNWCLAQRGFWCVWSWGLGGECEAYAADSRAVADGNGWHCVGCGRILSDADAKKK